MIISSDDLGFLIPSMSEPGCGQIWKSCVSLVRKRALTMPSQHGTWFSNFDFRMRSISSKFILVVPGLDQKPRLYKKCFLNVLLRSRSRNRSRSESTTFFAARKILAKSTRSFVPIAFKMSVVDKVTDIPISRYRKKSKLLLCIEMFPRGLILKFVNGSLSQKEKTFEFDIRQYQPAKPERCSASFRYFRYRILPWCEMGLSMRGNQKLLGPIQR